ncbi:putative ATP-dependent endonuclease of OLD family [Kitasatospora herbaricolor]|uniref:AAA family ATPase n=1 Tax=Kitasatospora herbaricolor TaxID=68217 RepID=UPI00174A42FE|nr:AAA family ATPase [Kitasatospora herbaricolor]MDQ0305530.1 putative ATP-dependent endonuclease of OLD family [Kitasatospora herbaricolor]
MQLTSVHARLFRNIVDSGAVAIEPDVTCFVGKNESGKTALLSALYRFNPVYPEDTFEVGKHYPRWRLVRDRKVTDLDTVRPISCVFELSDGDLKAVEEVLGAGVLTGRTFQMSVNYEGRSSVTLDIDEAAACRNVLDDEGAPQALRDEVAGLMDLDDMADKAASLQPEDDAQFTVEQAQAVAATARARLAGKGNAWGRAVQILTDRLPKFFYFGDYQTLPGRINLQELGGGDQPGATGLQTARALLRLADTHQGALTEEDFEERKAELEAVSNQLTEEVFEYWTQNPDLSVEIDIDKTTQNTHNGQTAVARYLDVRVKDRRHGFTNNFGQRSSGFQWFFSFLAAFSEFEDYPHGVVVLLDEPALTLHGKAQADFLRFIEERLAPHAQVIYTTHSPFMVDVAHLDRVRIVEDRGPTEGAVVTDEALAVTGDSLFPLEAALGYDIAQSLFVGPDNLLVEGTSDFTYLTLLSEHLKELGRTHLDTRWRILPAGGATNIPAFVALVGRALQVTVLIDGSPAGVTKLKNLADRGVLSKKRLLLTDMFTDGIAPSDIEDLFSPGDYLKLYNAAFGTHLKVAELNGADRIISRITRATGQQFTDHGRPAEILLRQRTTLLAGLSETTLSRFERLFEAINATLS